MYYKFESEIGIWGSTCDVVRVNACLPRKPETSGTCLGVRAPRGLYRTGTWASGPVPPRQLSVWGHSDGAKDQICGDYIFIKSKRYSFEWERVRSNLTKVRHGPFWPTAGCVTMWVSKRICPDEKRVVGRLRVYLTFENLIKFIVQWRPMYIVYFCVR